MNIEHKWLGLAIRSESDQPHEWQCIGWVIRNRVLSRRYPDMYRAVILSRKQFSYFNKYSHLLDNMGALYEAALQGYAGDNTGWSENDLTEAQECAQYIINSPRWAAPFGPQVWHYWSPVSMNPPGTRPAWANAAKRLFTPPGVDAHRFVFAEGVP